MEHRAADIRTAYTNMRDTITPCAGPLAANWMSAGFSPRGFCRSD